MVLNAHRQAVWSSPWCVSASLLQYKTSSDRRKRRSEMCVFKAISSATLRFQPGWKAKHGEVELMVRNTHCGVQGWAPSFLWRHTSPFLPPSLRLFMHMVSLAHGKKIHELNCVGVRPACVSQIGSYRKVCSCITCVDMSVLPVIKGYVHCAVPWRLLNLIGV